ncbi:MAG TPA: outer membrane beta-barrel protein [Puia sp.]|nr:outer membrane beta-barrel protein [Puia sp.]
MRFLQKYSSALALALVICSAAFSQNGMELNLNYNVGIPSGSLKDYVNKASFRGFTGSIDYAVSSRLRVGLGFGFNDYYQKYPRQVYDEGGNTSVSAVLSNSIQQYPLIAHASYELISKGIIKPYIGAGGGVNFISFGQYLGEFGGSASYTRFLLQGEAGILIPLSSYSSTAVKIGGTYNYAPFHEFGTKDLSSWGIQAGIRFPLH